jgi:hypothetical protein
MVKEILTEFVGVTPDDVPSLLEKKVVKTIRPWGLIIGKFLDDIINFLLGEGLAKVVKVVMSRNEECRSNCKEISTEVPNLLLNSL